MEFPQKKLPSRHMGPFLRVQALERARKSKKCFCWKLLLDDDDDDDDDDANDDANDDSE